MPDLNGSEPPNAAITALESMLVTRRERVRQLREELAGIEPELKRYEKALALLKDERPAPTPGRKPQRAQGQHTRVGAERLAAIKEVVLRLAAESDEFRQIDVRAHLDITSGVTAIAFERLRQEGWLRFARQQGPNKYYRLTTEGLRELEAAKA